MIRIVIICEAEHDRRTILASLSSQNDFQITHAGKSGYDALRFAADLQPDIIVMDIWLTDISGTDLAPLIKRKSPATGIVAIGSHNEIGRVDNALRAGISGILLKHEDMDKLSSAIRTVLYGGYYLSARIKTQMSTAFCGSAERVTLDSCACFALADISPVERGIISGLVLGYTDKEIADNLHIAAGTVRNILAALKRRAGLKNRIHVAIYAYLCGLISPPCGNSSCQNRITAGSDMSDGTLIREKK